MKRVMIIGGYGNIGSFISKEVAQEKNIQLIIAARSLEKAKAFVSTVKSCNVIETVALDINDNFEQSLSLLKPSIVIHTSGPFQHQGYDVANACINQNAHYIDLADGRHFVNDIVTLDEKARNKALLIISGASSVPCLTSALLDFYVAQFKSMESVDYGITTAQKTARGLATTKAILGYTGKPFKTKINGTLSKVYGWQSLHLRRYKNLGLRLLGNCDVPDLTLFPDRYPDLKTLRFYAGLELPFVHCTLWLLSWLVRVKLIRHLENRASLMLKLSFLFDRLGSTKSSFHMLIKGKDELGQVKEINFELTALSGDGPYIPCMPAILMTKKLINDEIDMRGAYPCVGFITLDEYLDALTQLDISWQVE